MLWYWQIKKKLHEGSRWSLKKSRRHLSYLWCHLSFAQKDNYPSPSPFAQKLDDGYFYGPRIKRDKNAIESDRKWQTINYNLSYKIIVIKVVVLK